MRCLFASFGALFGTLLLSGCGYIHFGRLEKTPVGSDAALVSAYTNLATEHKVMKQELALARKEGDALRAALDRSGAGAASSENTARLAETTRELAALRASYAKLQVEQRAGSAAPATGDRQRELEEKLAVTLREHTQLQEENSRLRTDLERVRRENTGLEEQLKASTARNAEATQALEMLNVELLAQKQARAKAEQANLATQAQLDAVLMRGSAPPAGNLAAARESTAASTAILRLGEAGAAGGVPTAELRIDTARLKPEGGFAPGAATPPPRRHLVKAGDTLEKIALQYYGTPDRWTEIRDANRTALGDRKELRAGLELLVP